MMHDHGVSGASVSRSPGAMAWGLRFLHRACRLSTIGCLWKFILCLSLQTSLFSSTHCIAAPPLPTDIAEWLSRHQRPGQDGAMGRNRGGYIHARFQCYLHRHVDHAISSEDVSSLRWFCDAAEYAMRHQRPDGGFDFVPPSRASAMPAPSQTDLASGTAFFVASLATGLLELDRSPWFRETESLQPERMRVAAIGNGLKETLDLLLKQRSRLVRADENAPNRLLLDALALMAGGELVDHDGAVVAGREFLDAALGLVHDEGYFIEGGGFDSSYNGVAIAIAYRIERFFPDDRLAKTADRAMSWQHSRIARSGEILTEGNARVHGKGEAFLGRRKDVDVAFTLEAMALAHVREGNVEWLAVARRVHQFYSRR